MIVVTGATGQLGRLVIAELLKTTRPKNIVAAVRSPAKADDLAARGVQVRQADYNRPETLRSAFQGTSKLLLISSNNMGRRVEEHRAVIDAARAAGVPFLAYTSLLHCDTSPLAIAVEHLATERYLQASGLSYVLLRNGWYYENQTVGIQPALKNGAFVGASGEGRFAAAARSEYAAAAAVVLTQDDYNNSILELGGDDPYTRAELAAEVSRQTGKTIAYRNLSEDDYTKVLSSFIPATVARLVADAEIQASHGALDDNSHTLRRLLGRPISTLADAVASALKAPPTLH